MNLPAAEAGGHAVAAAFGAGAADVKVDIRAEDLDAHLTGRRILFYEGHGDNALDGENVLAFRGPHGKLESMTNDDFVRIVKKHAQHGLCEVVLNGCRTHGLASRLRDEAGVAVVVCWATKAHDTAAAKFAETYADRRTRGVEPKTAFEGAQIAVTTTMEAGYFDNGCPGSRPKFALVDPCDATLVYTRDTSHVTRHMRGRLRAFPPLARRGPLAAGVPELLMQEAPSTQVLQRMIGAAEVSLASQDHTHPDIAMPLKHLGELRHQLARNQRAENAARPLRVERDRRARLLEMLDKARSELCDALEVQEVHKARSELCDALEVQEVLAEPNQPDSDDFFETLGALSAVDVEIASVRFEADGDRAAALLVFQAALFGPGRMKPKYRKECRRAIEVCEECVHGHCPHCITAMHTCTHLSAFTPSVAEQRLTCDNCCRPFAARLSRSCLHPDCPANEYDGYDVCLQCTPAK